MYSLMMAMLRELKDVDVMYKIYVLYPIDCLQSVQKCFYG